ncbi:hypothetical protein HOLleu_32435 [Holothuria leucospilota]|uniref:Uncharacterized protein n=1 Tax=Holothuria leucospilota TaxID=206669 RepID=A0A9Q1BIP8_HOLLE|nr:hypothetical protein HOLleu_32435 [Holothuria leucospilota]
MDPRLQHPFTCVKAGPTQCGKTVFLNQLLSHAEELIRDPTQVILWFYGEYQSLYDQLAETLANEPLKVKVLPETSSSVQPGDTLQKRVIERDVVESIPRAFKSKTNQLLGKIASNDSGLDWTNRGELVVNDHTVKGSRIVDLVNDMMRKRRRATPIGMDEFTKALARINTTRELIGNLDRWQDLSRWRDLGDAPRKVTERPLHEEVSEVSEDNDGNDQTFYAKAYHLPTKKRPGISPRKSKKAMRAREKYLILFNTVV